MGRIARGHGAERERELEILGARPEHVELHVLRSKRANRELLASLD